MKFMYITNRPAVAEICEAVGVDRVFVDLEVRGKAERQGHLDSVQSRHTFADAAAVRQVLKRSELLVRINPFYDQTATEVEQAIAAGADLIMLPMPNSLAEIADFSDQVRGRAKTVLLLETPFAEQNIEAILDRVALDEVHIGLNDLSLAHGLPFMFDLLTNGTVERLCHQIARHGVPYGFGGIARLGQGKLPTEQVLDAHVRLGSTRVILSRSFCKVSDTADLAAVRTLFSTELGRIRAYLSGHAPTTPAR